MDSGLFNFIEDDEIEEEKEETVLPEKTYTFYDVLAKHCELKEIMASRQKEMKEMVYEMTLNRFTKNSFESLYKETIGSEINLNENSKITLFCSHAAMQNLLEKVQHSVLPSIEELSITGVTHVGVDIVKNFLTHSIPLNLSTFSFNFCSPMVEGRTYLNEIK